jgi:TPR repeat protein
MKMCHRNATLILLIALALHAPAVVAQALETESPPCDPSLQSDAVAGADRGDTKQVYLLARYLSTGKCMPGDGKRSVLLYARAAKDHYPPAFYNLGMIAAASRDYARAEGYLFEGASLGHRGCELQLGILYGLAPPPLGDQRKAYAWLLLTSSRGEGISDEAKEILGKVGTRLSSKQKAQAEMLSMKLSAMYGNVQEFSP